MKRLGSQRSLTSRARPQQHRTTERSDDDTSGLPDRKPGSLRGHRGTIARVIWSARSCGGLVVKWLGWQRSRGAGFLIHILDDDRSVVKRYFRLCPISLGDHALPRLRIEPLSGLPAIPKIKRPLRFDPLRKGSTS
jgi:hypothetical protein